MVLEPNLMQSRNSLGGPGRGTLTVPRDCLIWLHRAGPGPTTTAASWKNMQKWLSHLRRLAASQRVLCGPLLPASFDALYPLAGTTHLRPGPGLRAVLTTDASNVAVAGILTQRDDARQQHLVVYERRKLPAAEQNYPAHASSC